MRLLLILSLVFPFQTRSNIRLTGETLDITTGITTSGSLPPSSSGACSTYDYDLFTFGGCAQFPGLGGSYVDPVFGTTIYRMTQNANPVTGAPYNCHFLYAHKRVWNADGTKLVTGNPASCGGARIIDIANNGAVVCSSVTINTNSSVWGFDPLLPDTFYYTNGAEARYVDIDDCSTHTVYTFPDTLREAVGNAFDWIDRTGDIWMVRYGPSQAGGCTYIWKKSTQETYTNCISTDVGQAYNAGLTPTGNYIVYTSNNDNLSFAINHGTKTVTTTGVQFWTLGGGHGDMLSATTGGEYFITSQCEGTCSLYRIDITLNMAGQNAATQKAANQEVLPFNSQTGVYGHQSCARKFGSNWCWASTLPSDDSFNSRGTWGEFRNEIVAINLITLEIRRQAHTRSRDQFNQYYTQAHVNASWDGTRVCWASNMNFNNGDVNEGYNDFFCIDGRGRAISTPLGY